MQEKIKHFIQKKHAVLPIITFDDTLHKAEDIVPIIVALQQGGLHAVEITLRSTLAINAIHIAREAFPNLCICAGTIVSTEQVCQLKGVGLDFIITPGISEKLLASCLDNSLDILPGVITPSEILLGIQYNLQYFKFFPATANNGVETLSCLSAPFSDCYFCATGGITLHNALDFLNMNNVFCVASSGIVTAEDIAHRHWNSITEKAKAFSTITQQ